MEECEIEVPSGTLRVMAGSEMDGETKASVAENLMEVVEGAMASISVSGLGDRKLRGSDAFRLRVAYSGSEVAVSVDPIMEKFEEAIAGAGVKDLARMRGKEVGFFASLTLAAVEKLVPQASSEALARSRTKFARVVAGEALQAVLETAGSSLKEGFKVARAEDKETPRRPGPR